MHGDADVTDDVQYVRSTLGPLLAPAVAAAAPPVPVQLDANAIDVDAATSSSSSSSDSDSEDKADGKDKAPRAAAAADDDVDELQRLVARAHFKETRFGPATPNELEYNAWPLEPLPAALDELDWVTAVATVTAVQRDIDVVVAKAVVPTHGDALRVLDMGSVIATAARQLLGRVDDVFGPVREPFYAVRIMDARSADALAPGALLFSVDRFASTVNPLALNATGTDASNNVDQERSDDDDDDASNDGAAAAGQPRPLVEAPARGARRGGRRGPRRGRPRQERPSPSASRPAPSALRPAPPPLLPPMPPLPSFPAPPSAPPPQQPAWKSL